MSDLKARLEAALTNELRGYDTDEITELATQVHLDVLKVIWPLIEAELSALTSAHEALKGERDLDKKEIDWLRHQIAVQVREKNESLSEMRAEIDELEKLILRESGS